jgi:hypothetical protein
VQTIDSLPLVKAYPALGKTYGEVSCIAGVRMDGEAVREWIRLYPVPFRALEHEQQFATLQPIRLQVVPHRGDRRPERLEVRREKRYGLELDEPMALVEAAGTLDRRPAPGDELRRHILAMRRGGKPSKALAAELDRHERGPHEKDR